METLNPELCYRAVASRDARFDGRFFTGVTSTGVYCRPVCPSRTPRRNNVRFFRSAAEAEWAGFRPCLRCRPESAPGGPAWNGTRTSIGQALRLIAAGYLDEHGVEELAGRLGMGPRHLHRLFTRHLGVPPLRIAQVRRAHFSRKLLADTRMPVTEIAFASGFGSLRQFNTLFRRLYGQSPMELRREAAAQAPRSSPPAPPEAPGGRLELRLEYRSPYPWDMVLDYLARRATPGVEAVRDRTYYRAIADGESAGIIEVAPGGEGVFLLRVRAPVSRALITVVERVRRLFDLAADPQEIGRHLRRDPWLAERVDRLPGLRVPGAWDGFELAVRAILGQQVSVAAATRAMGRLAERYGRPFPGSGVAGIDRLFPSPQALAQARESDLRLPGLRARALIRLAREVAGGTIRLDGSLGAGGVVERLAAIPGIGDWTVQYIAMRALGEPDAFPAGDLGLRRAAAEAGEAGEAGAAGGPRLPGAAELLRKAEPWRPWRAYAAVALWHSPPGGPPRRSPSAPAPARRAGQPENAGHTRQGDDHA